MSDQATQKGHLTNCTPAGTYLREHKKSVHEGRKFSCGTCDYQATQKGHLTAHQQSVHEGRIFSCDTCDYQATTGTYLTEHKKSVHEGRKFPCGTCDYQAARRGDLTTHQKSVHERKKFPCGTCHVTIRRLQEDTLLHTRGQFMKEGNHPTLNFVPKIFPTDIFFVQTNFRQIFV